MKPLLVKRKLGERTQFLVCSLTHEEGAVGPTPWHGPCWTGEKKFGPDDPYLFDTELSHAPYAGPDFVWRVRCPQGAWHWAFTVFDGQGKLLLASLEFVRPMTLANNLLTGVDLELDLYWLPQTGEVVVVDEDELTQAVARGLMSGEEEARVRAECEQARLAILAGNYPWPG